jgi:hypothetical protein
MMPLAGLHGPVINPSGSTSWQGAPSLINLSLDALVKLSRGWSPSKAAICNVIQVLTSLTNAVVVIHCARPRFVAG